VSWTSPQTGPQRPLWAAVAPFLLFAAAVAVLLGPSLVGTHVALAHDIHLEQLPWRATEAAEPARNPELRDTIDYYYPVQREIVLALREGRDATWLRELGLGHLGVEFIGWGALSPFNIPAAALPFDLAWSWAQALRLYAAMVGAYLLARRFGVGPAGATVTGLSFGLSGFVIAWLGWPHSHVAAAVPWVLWATRVSTGPQGPPWWGLPTLALAVASLWLGGFPALTLYGLIAAGVVAVHGLLAARGLGWRELAARTGAAAGGIVVGTLLVAFTVLPSVAWLDVMDLGFRTQALRQRVHAIYLWTYLFPGIFGDSVTSPRWSGDAYIEMVGYAGVVTLALILAAWALVPRLEGLGLFTLLGVAFGLLAFGFPPVVWVVGQIPPLATNAPNRTVVFLGLCIAMCGGMGADALVRRAAGLARPQLLAVAAVAGVVVLAVVAAVAVGQVDNLREAAVRRLDPEGYAVAREAAWSAVRRTVALLGAAAVVTAAVLWVRRYEPAAGVAPHVLGVGLCLVVAVDLVSSAHGWNTQVPRAGLFPDGPGMTELAELSSRHRTAGADGAGHTNTHLIYGIADFRARGFMTERQADVLRGMEVAFFTATRWDLRGDESERWEPWLSAAAVAAVVVPPGGTPPAGWSSDDLEHVELWHNPHARELVAAVPRAEPADGRSAELMGATEPAALRHHAYVEGAEASALPDGGTAAVLEWDTTGARTTARVTSSGGAVLVAADAAVPGWRAWVNGEPVPVLTADHLFLGVIVPPGEHDVELRYRAPGAVTGRLLSGLGLVLLLAGALLGRRYAPAGRDDSRSSGAS
jgi:hypothetical protein